MPSYSDLVLADGATLYLRLDESSGATVSSKVGGYTGTISGGVTLNQTGALADGNAAMAFDGITGTVDTTFPLPLLLSVELWLFRTGIGNGSVPRILYSDNTSSFDLATASGILYFHLNFTTLATGFINSGVIVPLNTWVHIVATWDGTTYRIHKNGVEGYNNATWAGRTLLPGTVQLGQISGDAYQGMIDEVAIYPTVLTAAQIATHYLARLGPLPSPSPYEKLILAANPSLYLRLDEPSGTTVVSKVGGYTGTISGGVTLNQPGPLSDGNAAMAFDGSTGRIIIPNGAYATVGTAFSIEIWAKATDYTARYVCDNKNAGDTTKKGFNLYLNGTDVIFRLGNGTVITALGVLYPRDQQWHHVVFVLGSNTVRSYVDGIAGATVAAPTGDCLSVDPLRIAAYSSAGASDQNSFIGVLDEVAIYPTALTPAQIADHYAARMLPAVAPYVSLVMPSGSTPQNQWSPITPSDFQDQPFAGLWVGGAGNIAAVMQDGTVGMFTAATAGQRIPILGRRVNATGTTATQLLAMRAL